MERVLSESNNVADVPYYKETPLACASRYGHLEIVRYLVLQAKCAIDVNPPSTDSDSTIHIACAIGKIKHQV